MLELRAGDALVEVDPAGGGRIERLQVDGLDLLVTRADDPRQHGCFPMAPWAGRTGHGQFTFAGEVHRLPRNSAPHAIHGTVRDQPWRVVDADRQRLRITCDLGPAWPFTGRAEQVIAVHADRLELALSVHATGAPMPAAVGWHPWFRRSLAAGAGATAEARAGGPAEVDIDAGAMIRRGADHLPVALPAPARGWELVRPPPAGPWDDCFVELRRPPVVRWPGALELEVESDCACVVVYDEQAGAVCVEPQSAPPDALNHDPPVVRPGRPLVAHAIWRWRPTSTTSTQ